MSFIRVYILVSITIISVIDGTAVSMADDVAAAPAHLDPIEPASFTPSIQLPPQETHSGYKLPRWVSLKYHNINGRKGPGEHFSHIWTFRRKGMPVIVVNEMDNWRKIRDIEGGESWVHNVALSGRDMGVITRYSPLLKKASPSAATLAQLSPNVMLILKSCSKDYCAVEIDPEIKRGKKKGRKGYVARRDIWGAEDF